jgi:hypothetical protein
MSVTAKSLFASAIAADNPPKPAPTITMRGRCALRSDVTMMQLPNATSLSLRWSHPSFCLAEKRETAGTAPA